MECKLDNITVHYEVRGTGKPLLVLHGWTQNSQAMIHFVEPLLRDRAGWQRIYIDLPGHGRTPGEEWISNQDQMLDVVLGVIDQVIQQQRFAIAGVSLGAYLARGVVYHRASKLDGLLMVVPVIVAEHSKRAVPEQMVVVKDAGITDEIQPHEQEVFSLAVVQTHKYLAQLRADMPDFGPMANAAFLNRFLQPPENYAFSFDVDALSKPFPAPTLIVTGRQDFVVGYKDSWRIYENFPRGTLVVLDRAGHLLEEQEAVLRVLGNEWLSRVEEWSARAT
jgi:pimeloyl-ACP methyl ester carboxylesterase